MQGVGFRATTRAIARRHGVRGWVRNEPDGSVSASIEGDAEAIDACLAELGERMSGYLRGVEAERFGDERGCVGFEILR